MGFEEVLRSCVAGLQGPPSPNPRSPVNKLVSMLPVDKLVDMFYAQGPHTGWSRRPPYRQNDGGFSNNGRDPSSGNYARYSSFAEDVGKYSQENSQRSQEHGTSQRIPKKLSPALQIEEIRNEVSVLQTDIENSVITSRSDKQFVYLDEMLTRSLLKLDVIESDGNDEVRAARKSVVNYVKFCISLLEDKVQFIDCSTSHTSYKDEAIGGPASEPDTLSTARHQQLEDIEEEVKKLAERIQQCTVAKRTDKEFLYLDEMLTGYLLKLDNIVVSEDLHLREDRRNIVAHIHQCISTLEQKVKHNSGSLRSEDSLQNADQLESSLSDECKKGEGGDM